jgi:glutamate-ammonia-ligase adenylyltransferase
VTARWPSYPALRSQRALGIFKRLRPEILRALAEAARPEEALTAFDGFLRGLPAGVQLFSLFEANPDLTRLIADIPGQHGGSRRAGTVVSAVGQVLEVGTWPAGTGRGEEHWGDGAPDLSRRWSR